WCPHDLHTTSHVRPWPGRYYLQIPVPAAVRVALSYVLSARHDIGDDGGTSFGQQVFELGNFGQHRVDLGCDVIEVVGDAALIVEGWDRNVECGHLIPIEPPLCWSDSDGPISILRNHPWGTQHPVNVAMFEVGRWPSHLVVRADYPSIL